MKPETVHPVSNGRWVGLDSWPSADVAMKTLSMTYGKLQEEANTKEEIVRPLHITESRPSCK